MKIIKYISLIVLVTIIGIACYIYYLTFTPHGRLNWGQAVFPMEATAKDKFKFDQAGAKFEFNPTEKTMILFQGGGQINFTKE